jgi:hypothetical protein
LRKAELDPADLFEPPAHIVGEIDRQAVEVVLELFELAGTDDRDTELGRSRNHASATCAGVRPSSPAIASTSRATASPCSVGRLRDREALSRQPDRGSGVVLAG